MLIPILKHPDREARSLALYDLTEHCRGAKALRPAMLEVLGNRDGGNAARRPCCTSSKRSLV